MTTPGTTETLATEVEETAAGAALAAGLDAIARLHDDALDLIAHLADSWDETEQTDGAVHVLRLAERPVVAQRVDAAA